MKIFQEERSSNRYRKPKIDLLDIVVILFLFSAPVLNIFLYLTKKTNLSGQLAVIYIIVAIAVAIVSIFIGRKFIPMSALWEIVFLFLILVDFLITKNSHSSQVARFDSELKLYIATIPSVVMITLCLFWWGKKDISLLLVFGLDLLLTIVCSLVLVNSTGVTTAGLMLDSSGFLYQNTSYYAAYTLGMTVFMIQEQKRNLSIRIPKIVLFLLVPIQIGICFMAGGRGGIILILVVLLWAFFSEKRNIEKLVLTVCFVIITVVAVIYFVPVLMRIIGVDSTGYERTIMLLTTGISDQGREALWANSIEAFKERPIFGNGIGSVFYLFNSYSHNMFVDILCEKGVVGLLIVVSVFILYGMRVLKLYKAGSIFRFMFMVFLCGFTMNLFSGYVWVNQQILLPVTATLVFPKSFKFEV